MMALISIKLKTAINSNIHKVCWGVKNGVKVGNNSPCIISSTENPETKGDASGKLNVCKLNFNPVDADAGLSPLERKKI